MMYHQAVIEGLTWTRVSYKAGIKEPSILSHTRLPSPRHDLGEVQGDADGEWQHCPLQHGTPQARCY